MPRSPQSGDLVLVTGATGRIGANLCRTLRERGFRIRGIVLPGDPAVAKLAGLDAEIAEADLRDEQAVIRACEGVDAICHLAALMGPDAGEMPVSEYWHLNVDATLHVLEGARLNGNLKRFVFASTDATYAAVNPRYVPMDENHPQDPVNLYGLTKVVGEQLCKDYLTEFQVPTAIVRYGGVGSPDERATGRSMRLSAQIQRFKDAKQSHNNYLWVSVQHLPRPWEYLDPLVSDVDPLIALTDTNGRPFISHPTDVRDAVQGTVLALESDASVGEAFNILGPSPVSSIEQAKYLGEKLDTPWRTALVPFRQAYEMSIAKARAVLGYRPAIDFYRAVDDGLAMLRGEDIGIIPAKLPLAKPELVSHH
jgi:UDP-glucose 4-epimerase